MTHFPDHPHDGETVAEEIGPDQARIWTYNEAKNEWTYRDYGPGGQLVFTDQVLVRDNTEVPGMALADPSTLKTQKEVNYWLDEKAGQGGGGGTPGKESLPWLQIDRWGMRKNPYFSNPIYEVRWSNNPNCTYTWQYEIDGDGDGNWIDIAEHPQKDELGFSPSNEFPIQLSLAGSEQADILPNALMRFRLTGELNGVLSELSSGAIAAWEERMDDYDPPLYETGIAVDLDPYATTDYVDEKVGAYLPLTGGTIAGELRVNKPNDQPIFEVTEDKVLLQKHATNIQQLELKEIINVGILDNLMRDPGQYGYLKDYLLLAGGSMKGDIAMNGHQVTGMGTPKKDGHACTKGYVDEQIAGIEIPEIPEIPDFELSTKDKLYLQGFYPFKFGEGTQINDPGEFLVKDYNYLVTQDPEKWKFLYFSTTDAYGQDLAGQFLNHMHMDAQHEGQVWICKENGYKLCGYIGKMRPRDQNFERYFNLEMDNSVQLLNPPNYDTQALRVDKGEVLWIKCSFWG